jgi:hypothetical protein
VLANVAFRDLAGSPEKASSLAPSDSVSKALTSNFEATDPELESETKAEFKASTQ